MSSRLVQRWFFGEAASGAVTRLLRFGCARPIEEGRQSAATSSMTQHRIGTDFVSTPIHQRKWLSSSAHSHKLKPRKAKEHHHEPLASVRDQEEEATPAILASTAPTEPQEATPVFWRNSQLLRWDSPTCINKVSYWAGMDANAGLLKDRLNPSAYLTFADKNANSITVRYQCDMTCYGPKIDFSLRTFGAFLWVTGNTQLEHIPKEIKLGGGIEVEFFAGFGIVKVVAPFPGYLFYAGGLSGVGVGVFKRGGRLLIDEQYDQRDIRTRFPLVERSYLKPYTQVERPNTAWSYLKLIVFYANFLMILLEFNLDLNIKRNL